MERNKNSYSWNSHKIQSLKAAMPIKQNTCMINKQNKYRSEAVRLPQTCFVLWVERYEDILLGIIR